MKIFDLQTLEEQEAEIVLLGTKDYATIKSSRRFNFNWEQVKGGNVYKLVKKGEI